MVYGCYVFITYRYQISFHQTKQHLTLKIFTLSRKCARIYVYFDSINALIVLAQPNDSFFGCIMS